MTPILHHIRSLESYVERSGGRLVRTDLPEWVHGGVFRDLITLQADLSPEQQLAALVHELAHWLAHRDAGCHAHGAHRTIYEYEAEAVEVLVMARLGLPHPRYGAAGADPEPPADIFSSPTDGLLSSSVRRVMSTTRRICQALGLEQG
jgi:uncharacterized protein DUF955